ncbi:MAG: hypothetical protein ABI972_29540, partial [Acidobacteriota bacterium]
RLTLGPPPLGSGEICGLAILNHEAPNRNGLWALPYPIAAPRPQSPSQHASSTDYAAMNRALFSDPAFLAKHAPQMLEKLSINPTQFNPTQFNPTQIHPTRK